MIKIKARIKDFFEGRAFAPFVALTVFLSHILGTEIFTSSFILIISSLALWLTDSLLPQLPPILFSSFLISTKHSPSYPGYSDYLFHGTVTAFWAIFGTLYLISLVFFFKRERKYKGIKFGQSELFGTLIFAGGMLFISILSLDYRNVLFSLIQAAALVLPLILFLFGCNPCDAEKFRSAVIYNSLIMVFLVLAELLALYFSGGVIQNGAIVKEKIALGWGIWNNIGASFVFPIPLIMLGIEKSPHRSVYLLGALASFAGAVLTLSRNALLFGILALCVSLALLSVRGARRKYFRRVTFGAIIAALVFSALLWDKILLLLSDVFERGFSDNGRFALYREALHGFLENFLFGNGFYEYNGEYHQFADFFPRLPHSTPLALAFAGGLFLLGIYAYYRYTTLIGAIKRPTVSNILVIFSAILLPLMSLIDNFFFNIYPTFLYTASIAAIYHDNRKDFSMQAQRPKLTLKKIFNHTRLVLRHKRLVFRYCAKCGFAFRGLIHDLSKFSPEEFFESARWYQGNRSPIGVCRRETGMSAAWLHHKGRNKHHLEYWLDGDCKIQPPMPFKYAVECVCDKLAATRIYNGKNYNPEQLLSHWFKYGNKVEANPATMLFIERVFLEIAECGEAVTLKKARLKEIYDKAMTEQAFIAIPT